jgi:hypothetical protein
MVRRVANPEDMVNTSAAIHTPTATPSRESIKSNPYTTRAAIKNICTTTDESCHQRIEPNVGVKNDNDDTLCVYE